MAAPSGELSEPGCIDPGALTFTEPNLSFESHARDVITVGFDLECRPPWRASWYAGDPVKMEFLGIGDQLVAAADDWDADLLRYPDRSSTGTP